MLLIETSGKYASLGDEMMDGNRILRPAAMLAVLLCLLMMTAGAVPPLPAEFYGKVTVDSAPASVGTALIAKINDQVRGKLALTTAGQYGGTGIFEHPGGRRNRG